MSDPLEDLPPLRDVIREHGLRAEKKLGQNFLLDQNLTRKIARQAGSLSGTVFEIGPGPGGLTRAILLETDAKVVAIEYDTRAIDALQGLVEAAQGRLALIHGDALNTDLTALAPDGPRHIVANLPYNIATPLLVGWLEQVRDARAFQSMTLMFQKEVAQRIVAEPGSKMYGRLAVLSQWLCEAKLMMSVPASAFTPPPKVTSAIVRLLPRDLPADAPAFNAIERVTAAAFGQRRKMLRGSLKQYAEKMDALGIDASLRAEDLPVADYIRLARD